MVEVYLAKIVAARRNIAIATAFLLFLLFSLRTLTEYSHLRRKVVHILSDQGHENRDLVVYVYYDGKMTQEDQAIRTGWGTMSGFSFSESVNTIPVQTDNLKFFLNQGLLTTVDYLFVMHSPMPAGVSIPDLPNLFVWHKENRCYDLGAFKQGVEHMESKYGRSYQRYLLINASVRGPFLPPHDRSCWIDHFFNKLDERTKLVGTTFYCEEGPFASHVQTMVLAFDRAGYEAGLPAMQCPGSIDQAIKMGEVPLTGFIKEKGYNVEALQTAYSANPDLCPGDMNYAGKYYGMSFHPYELIFIKSNRGIDNNALAHYTNWHDQMIDRGRGFCKHHLRIPK
ncbi:hypothetical protein HKX48_004878 [Thoreauomyces humboldtii]|nr:hypothetical protein HKX48_004878 [Thoreauomyces humboldtii]